MKIISFAWTTPALLAKVKTVTRRFWQHAYAAKFQPGDEVAAYDRSPRFGGKRVCTIRIISVTYESTADMPDSDYEAEGFAYMERIGKGRPNLTSREAFDEWRKTAEEMFVVRFKIVADNAKQEKMGKERPLLER